MSELRKPTYEQLRKAAKRHLKITYTLTMEIDGLELSVNGIDNTVYAKNELGQSNIIAENGTLRDGVSNIIIHDWFRNKPTKEVTK